MLGISATTKTGQFGQGWQFDSQTIEKSLLHVAQAVVLHCRMHMAMTWLSPLSTCLNHIKIMTLSPIHKMPCPSASRLGPTAAQSNHAVTNTHVMVFSFSLRVSKYTCPHGRVVTPQPTIQFRVHDVCDFGKAKCCSHPPAIHQPLQLPPG